MYVYPPQNGHSSPLLRLLLYTEQVYWDTGRILTRSGAGAAYGTAKSGIGIANVGTYRPDLIMKVRARVLDMWRRAEAVLTDDSL